MSTEPRIRRSPDGTRYVQPYLGTNKVTGKRIRPYRSFPASMSDEEVEREARRWYAEVSAGLKYGTALRLRDQLDAYVSWIEAERTAANTVKTYRTFVRNYLGSLGGIDPRTITTAMVGDLYHELLVSGGRRGGKLSPNTVIQVHWFLCGAFDWLVQRGVCATNPARAARKPPKEPHEAVALDRGEFVDVYDALEEALADEPEDMAGAIRHAHLFAAWLALHTGMRCGECCAVRRTDVDFRERLVRVRGTVVDAGSGVVRQDYTKGRHPRTLSVVQDEMEFIRRYVAWQDGLIGSRASKRTLVSVDGSLIRPKDVSATFSRLARELNLTDVTFHSLRHTHGTWLLMKKFSPKDVAERLGHKDVATTLRIYAHVLPGRDEQMAQGITSLRNEIGEEE